MSELLFEIALAQTPKIGPVRFHALLEAHGTAKKAVEAIGQDEKFSVKPCLKAAEALIDSAQKQKVTLLSCCSRYYPEALRQLHDAPPFLFVRGNADLLQRSLVAMVGARQASYAGQKLAYTMAREVSEAGHVLVSGFAKGIDHAVHKGAQKKGSVAVFAGGVDQIFPSDFESYVEPFLETGVIVSEVPLGVFPTHQNFPRRNRIISGLSRLVVVIEAAYQSGSLLTAEYAAQQGREVAAVPGSPFDPRCKGTNKLLREGAHFVEMSWDILSLLGEVPAGAQREEFLEIKQKKEEPSDVSERVLELLTYSFIDLNELLRQIPSETYTVLEAVSSLELAGKIIRNAHNQIALRPE